MIRSIIKPNIIKPLRGRINRFSTETEKRDLLDIIYNMKKSTYLGGIAISFVTTSSYIYLNLMRREYNKYKPYSTMFEGIKIGMIMAPFWPVLYFPLCIVVGFNELHAKIEDLDEKYEKKMKEKEKKE